MKAFIRLTLAILRVYFREPLTVILSLFLVAFMMILFGIVTGENQFSIHLPILILNQSKDGQSVIQKIKSDDLLTYMEVKSESEILEQIRLGKVIGGLIITKDYKISTRNFQNYTKGIRIIADNNLDKWSKLGLERLYSLLNLTQNTSQADSVLEIHEIPVIKSRYIDYIFPGILAMAIMQSCLASAVVLLHAKKIGVIRRLRITPLSLTKLISSFISGRFIITLVHLIVLIVIALFIFKVNILTSLGELILIISLGVFLFMAMATFIAVISPGLEAGNIIIQLINFPMVLLSGVFIKMENMPSILEGFAQYLPLTYLVNILRGTVNMGLPISSFSKDIQILLGWSILFLVLSGLTLKFKKLEGE